ncbi:MAG: prephenate dehydrogenase [Bacteroidales bacterium]|nr:prephenate dehydrogenase [Bacteroidales bacterium]MCF8337644.1 prephenate dehydrogenase [Bacteroidales bacterium]
MKLNTIGIIGLGLIGGSLALDLKKKFPGMKIIGVEKDCKLNEKIIKLGLVDEIKMLEEAVSESDLVVLGTPPDVSVRLLDKILALVTDQVVTDVSSVKKPLIEVASKHNSCGRYVATHPMAGTEYSGPEAATNSLFQNKACIICDHQNSDADALELVNSLFSEVEMRIINMDATEHDRHAAYVSHISHISSFALALTVLEKEQSERNIFDLASGGFDSTVRLAKSAASMWQPVFELNRENIIDVIKNYEKQLGKFREAIANGDTETITSLIGSSNKIKKVL